VRTAALLRFVAWSDYLCPWCANASLRLQRIEAEYSEIEIAWRSYLLRPTARPAPASEVEAAERLRRFRHYVRSWQRPAAEADAATFHSWEAGARPPTHSMPAQVVAKAARRIDPAAFRGMHAALLEAYFDRNRDISDDRELRSLWIEQGLREVDFPELEDRTLVAEVLRDHRNALEHGVTGVPAVMLVGNDAVVVGAQPLATYRRWVERSLERALRSAGGEPGE
jgi:predicted DsbA family dithiol-disulfide isomerase